MLPVNDLKFQPPFLGLQNEKEVIGTLDTIMQKKILSQRQKLRKMKREKTYITGNPCVLSALLTSSNLLASHRKQELGESQFQRWTKSWIICCFFYFWEEKVTIPVLSVINLVPYYTGNVIYLEYICQQIRKWWVELFPHLKATQSVSNRPFYALLGKKAPCNLCTSYTARVILRQFRQAGPCNSNHTDADKGSAWASILCSAVTRSKC